MAAAEGSLGFLPRRIFVKLGKRKGGRAASLPKRVWEKNCSMAEPLTELESAATADMLTEDRSLGGRLILVQPKRGHRVGTDAALLVAAAGDARQGRIVDVGAGVGAVGLALAQRHPLASTDLVEVDPELARLAESNAARNGLEARTRVSRLDALNSRERRKSGLAKSASCVVTNPPFFDAKTVRASPDEGRARAHVLARAEAGATLADWIQASLAMLAPGGRFLMIHRPDALGAIPRGDRKRARRARASAGSSDDRRERASSAGFGRERLQGPSAPCRGAGPARGRRPTDGGGGRHPSRRPAYRLGRVGSTAG